jgi:hypothetical protein
MIKVLTKIAKQSEWLVRRLHGESNGGFEDCSKVTKIAGSVRVQLLCDPAPSVESTRQR